MEMPDNRKGGQKAKGGGGERKLSGGAVQNLHVTASSTFIKTSDNDGLALSSLQGNLACGGLT